jgi:hypothetical protein
MAALTHVPPPAPPERGVRPADTALARWREKHEPWRLTYARGPGFVRIYDRRSDRESPAVIVLRERQADVFLAFEDGCTVEDAARRAPEIPPERVMRFVGTLAENRLLIRGNGSFHLALPIRRKVEERWIEQAYP